MKFSFFFFCVTLCTSFALGETPPQEVSSRTPQARVDESNSWATLGRLYVILATTDDAESCGTVAKNNGDAIAHLFRTQTAQKAVTVLKIPPQHLSRQTVLSLIANLPLREDDAVVFYYSGKGDFDRKYGQYFELPASKEEIYRSEIRSAINKKKTRLCVLISDCCDPSVIRLASAETPPSESTPSEPASQVEEVQTEETQAKKTETNENPPSTQSENTLVNVQKTTPLFFSLFFSSRGTIDINAASFGQVSCVNEDKIGCFTKTLSALLDANRNKIISWQRIFPYLQEGTSLTFIHNFPEGVDIGEGRQQKGQTPTLLQLGSNTVESPTRTKIYPTEEEIGINATSNADEKRREDDRQAVMLLVQHAVGELRPFDTEDRGTHENLNILDTDNTILGMNGKAFSKEIVPVRVESAQTESQTSTATEPANAEPKKVRLGVQAANNKGDGVIITRVVPDFPGQRAGLEVGDVIIEIDGKKITSEKEFSDAIDAASGKITLVTRNKSGKTDRVTVGNLKETSAE